MPLVCSFWQVYFAARRYCWFVVTTKINCSAVAERPRDASCLSVASIVQQVYTSSASSSSDLTLSTNKLCSVLFSSSCSCMLQVQTVINIASLLCRRLCDKLHGGLSQLLFVCPAVIDRQPATIRAYHTCIRRPRQGVPRRNIATTFSTQKLPWCGLHDDEKMKIYLFVWTEFTNMADRRTDTA